MQAKTQQEPKIIGEKIGINPVDWRADRRQVMYEGYKAKFMQNPVLNQFLINTGERTLVEASKHDKYWGSGLGLRDLRSQPDTTNWPGDNNLGLILMRIHQDLHNGHEDLN